MPTQSIRSRAIPALPVVGFVLLAASATSWLPAAKAANNEVATDDLQRSLLLDTYRIVADQGAGRGETLYFYKCWMCHIQYTKTAPLLKDLYQHKMLRGRRKSPGQPLLSRRNP